MVGVGVDGWITRFGHWVVGWFDEWVGNKSSPCGLLVYRKHQLGSPYGNIACPGCMGGCFDGYLER